MFIARMDTRPPPQVVAGAVSSNLGSVRSAMAGQYFASSSSMRGVSCLHPRRSRCVLDPPRVPIVSVPIVYACTRVRFEPGSWLSLVDFAEERN